MNLTKNLSKVELKKSENEVTGKMGLCWVAGCLEHFGMVGWIREVFKEEKKSNREILAERKILAGALSQMAGGQRVEDVEVLRKDVGLLSVMNWKAIVCADTLLKFMSEKRNSAKMRKVNELMSIDAMRKSEIEEFTYDHDATYLDSKKKSAEYSYQKKKQFSGLIGMIAELGIINTVEYRRGNESPAKGILNQLRKAVKQAKKSGKRIVRFRSDSAAHQLNIFRLCDRERIKYYVSIKKQESVVKAIKEIEEKEWRPLTEGYAKQVETEYAESSYVCSGGFRIRILVLRWKNRNQDLFEDVMNYHVIGTNDFEIEPMEWLEEHNGRMGTIEQVNKEIKNEFACSYTPSHEFEKNRSHFILGVLAYNMTQIMKLFYLGETMIKAGIKRIRYWFINVCGKITKSGRKFCCHIMNVTDETYELFEDCKRKLKIRGY